MKTDKMIILAIIVALSVPNLAAQEKEKEAKPYWYASFFSLSDWDRIDSLKNIKKEYIDAISKDAIKQGKILDYKILFHHTGDINSVVVLTKHPSWCSIEENWFSATYKEMEPDEEKRKEFWDALSWVYEGAKHYDCIYTE